APALVTGSAQPHHGWVTADLGDLAGRRVSAPKQRPPFFSIDEPLLASWRLNVKVVGNRALRVQSPIFYGDVSLNMDLLGTMEKPVAVGTAEITGGVVTFPFAAFEVQSGFVTLSRDNPYRPQLNVTAISKQFGYEIQMHV